MNDPDSRLRAHARIVLLCLLFAALLILAAVTFGADPVVPAPRQAPVRNDAAWLMVGGVIGAFFRALRTSGQKNVGWETLQDCFLGAAIGLLWNVEIGPLGAIWPPFELSEKASTVQRAGLVAVFVWLTVEIVKPFLFRWAPKYAERLIGRPVVEDPGGTGPPEAPKPPTP